MFPLRSSHDLVRPTLVGWVAEQRANVVHKERIQELGDLLLVGKVESALKGNPFDELATSCRTRSAARPTRLPSDALAQS
jgi:hypothetical protein